MQKSKQAPVPRTRQEATISTQKSDQVYKAR